jgi:hypothetical protein
LSEKVPLDFEPVRGWVEVEVRDPEGRVVQRGRHEMRSFLNNFLKVFEGLMNAIGGAATSVFNLSRGTATVVNTAGSSATIVTERYTAGGTNNSYCGGTPMATQASSGDDTYGIVIGSGTTGVSLDQYNLASKISHGTSAGQLSYGVSSFDDLGLDTTVSPPVYRFRLVRTFSNLSTVAVSIGEVGIIARCYWKYDAAIEIDVKYMIARDLLPSTYTVPVGGSATVAIVVEVVLG